MATEKLQPNDKRLIVFTILVALVSVWYTWTNFTAAFPQASIDLRYSKHEITAMAERFLKNRGLRIAGFRNLTLFDPDDDARLYLEREMGLEEANRLMQRKVSVWRWRARWFQPPEKEEMRVLLSPDGRLVGFQHTIAEAAAGARLEKEAAQSLAQEFLQRQTSEPQRLVEEQLEERPNRYDYVFTWEEEGFRAKDATYRRSIVVQGDRLGSYSEYLHVPEQWKRDFARLRSANDLYAGIAQAFYIPLILAAVAVLIASLRRHQVRWRPLIVLSAVIGGLMVANQWNTLPFFIDGMPTSTPYREMLALGFLEGLGAGVGVFFYVILAAAAGEPLYRAAQPSNLALRAAISRRGIRTKEFFLGTIVGYGFAAFHIAFVVAFYLIGRRFGAWSPQDVQYSDLLSTSLPWIYPLTISLLAASSEEFWFRLLAIPLLRRYLRFWWIAILVPAFVWGFLHANYPQQPGYIRGLEVGIIGVAAGFLMLRYGILSTLVWHYTVDAVLIGLFLFQAESWYFRISGLAVAGAVMFPLVIALFLYRRHGGFLSDASMLNTHETAETPPPAPLEAETTPAPAAPLAPRWPARWLYVACALAVAAGVLLKPFQFGDFLEMRITASQAAAIADRALDQRGLKAAAWRRATQFVSNLNTADFEYVRRISGNEAANRTVLDRTHTGVWYTRYFRPMQKEEWRMYVDQNGRAYRSDHLLDEKAPGAKLDPGQARLIAERYLVQEQRLPLENYRLVDSSEEKRENRTDHSFVWENNDFRIGEAKARVSLSVIGDEVSNYRRFLKLPEQWLREFQRPRLQQYIVPALVGAVCLPLLIVFIRRLGGRQDAEGHRLHWKAYLLAGGIAALVSAVSGVNQWPLAFFSYDTARPLEHFLGSSLLNRLVVILFSGVAVMLGTLAVDVFLQLAAGYRALPRPSLSRALAVALLVWGVDRTLDKVGELIPGDRFSLPLWNTIGPDTFLPAVAVLTRGFFSATLMFCLVAILAAAAFRFGRGRRGGILIVVSIALVAFSRASNIWQWSFHFLEAAVLIALVVFVLQTCALDLVSFYLALWWLSVAAGGAQLIVQPASMLAWSGAAALAVAALAGLLWLRKRRAAGSPRC